MTYWIGAPHVRYARRMNRSALAALAALVLSAGGIHAQAPLPIPDDGRPVQIVRAGDIPPALREAIGRSGCTFGEVTLATFAILLFRPAPDAPPMAIVPCEGTVLHSRAFLLDGTALSFPVLVFAERLSEIETPGFFLWDARTKTLTALQGNDECDGTVMRHTYRHGGGPSGRFVLTKVERGRLGCGFGENWVVVWEADRR